MDAEIFESDVMLGRDGKTRGMVECEPSEPDRRSFVLPSGCLYF
jgi:hypothetical protein